MQSIKEMTKDELLSEEILTELFDNSDKIWRASTINKMMDRAAELKIKSAFSRLLKAYEVAERQMEKAAELEKKIMADKRKRDNAMIENWTDFGGKYPKMRCKSWIAGESGIFLQNTQTGTYDYVACYHPILPIRRLKNLQTGEEQCTIAFKRSGTWEELTVPKVTLTSVSKIVYLSSKGISVTSENAKYLVRYLADVEFANEDSIELQLSSSKLGWHKDIFLPYDDSIVFDGDYRFKAIKDAIKEQGRRNAWFNHVRELRQSERTEARFMLAASFASVIVKRIGALPFIVDLWGTTGGGKSVTLMLAASVWANPAESAYIKDYNSTDVALESISDLLNSLPLILDDTSQKNRRIEERFESIVYNLCAGKGKMRSNTDIGINRESSWYNCTLTNGERPLSSYVSQGGAINRILEVECKEDLYDDPAQTVKILKQNYGFAGREFIDIVLNMGDDAITSIYNGFLSKLEDAEKMQKQVMALAVVLTADKIITEYLFKDNAYLDVDEVKNYLTDVNEVSDNERCYQYMLSKIAMNPAKFSEDVSSGTEKWGKIEGDYAYILVQAFDDLCKSGGFSRTSFLSWAKEKGKIETSKGRLTRLGRFGDRVARCIVLYLEQGKDGDGFMQIDENSIPFD